ncbi:thiamine phosphate synthase [Aliikangiella maris]|uniref:Thiamine phosphate synthase n=2 Tax=Aliikangiella maris TaxID=3162458 RepID=A0ABV3MMA8_9GAMM
MSLSTKPIVLTIAANDSAGMAGISADLKTQHALGVHSLSVITATTAQNGQNVESINPVDAAILSTQLEAVKPYAIDVVKIGMVCNVEQVKVIAQFLRDTGLPTVLDPVFAASSGATFIAPSQVAIYADTLLPLCTLVTPNLDEAAKITGLSVTEPEQISLAAESLLLMGADTVLIKGGHGTGLWAQDYFASQQTQFWLSSQRRLSRFTRGTGCILASAIASALALNYAIEDAIVIGKMTINQGIQRGYSTGIGDGAPCINHFPDAIEHLPYLNYSPEVEELPAFANCGNEPLGLYPIVDRAYWLTHLLPAGVTTIQLRIKDLTGAALEKEIGEAVEIANRFNARLFINDYWQLAIQHGAYGVHLGQEDLHLADLQAIQAAGLRLGLSTHCHYEVARAAQFNPSYLACGPVFPTNTKKMPWQPHGIDGLKYWRKVIDKPLVAIAGINQTNFKQVADTGVDGIAMITAITHAEDPVATTREYLALLGQE